MRGGGIRAAKNIETKMYEILKNLSIYKYVMKNIFNYLYTKPSISSIFKYTDENFIHYKCIENAKILVY